MHKVFEFFEAWAEEKAVALRFVGSPCRVTGDPLMLRRAISNLLSNAIRYTPAGQAVTIQLSESAETVRPWWRTPVRRLPPSICRACLTDSIASTPRASAKGRAAASARDCEIDCRSPPRQRGGTVRSALDAVYCGVAEIGAIRE